ncbi:hypothetical protein QQF64_020419 [Cirrhinus molitorella]|uniref:Uncharacterized protein n=1 Tax=Cirrhinus molitorella TaxID=172907 RepID=A0ABR3LCM0_9TELE
MEVKHCTKCEKLWQLTYSFSQTPKHALHSKQDEYALECLEQKTKCEEINGTKRYRTPLLRVKNAPVLKAPPEAVMPALRRMERQLARDLDHASLYDQEIQKLIDTGCVRKLTSDEVESSDET